MTPMDTPQPPRDETTPPAARRRRARRFDLPPAGEEQMRFLEELAHRVTPSFDFYLFSLLAGLALAAAIIIDAPAFYVLSALLAPFMAPVVGLAFSTVLGSGRFFARMLAALLVGSLILFAWGALAGWLARLMPALDVEQAALHARLAWGDIALLLLGAWLTAYTLVRSPQQRPLVTSVALAYEIYLPAGVAGFGLAAGLPEIWQPALLVFILHTALAAITGALALLSLGVRPRPTAGVAAAVLLAAAIAAAIVLAGSPTPSMPPAGPVPAATQVIVSPPAASLPVASPLSARSDTPVPSETPTPPGITRTPTNTIIPTRTPTVTTTPIPTPLWAVVSSEEGGGVIVHDEPGFQTGYVASLINGVLVVVLSDAAEADGVAWVRVRTPDGREGWVVRALLTTATPAPGW